MKFSPVRAKLSLSLALGLSALSLAILACFAGLAPEDGDLTKTQAPFGFDEGGEGPRGGWFYAQRAYPLKTMPRAALMRALDQLEREEKRLRELYNADPGAFSNLDAQSVWTPLGPAPIGEGQTFGAPRVAVSGRATCVALDPGYDGSSNQTVYLGAAMGGVGRSRENGAAWAPLTDEQRAQALGEMA